jgi:uncharacterized membrane protein (UPF0127 family)
MNPHMTSLLRALVVPALLLAACSPQAGAGAAPTPEAPATHAVSGLQVIPLTIKAGGKTHRFQVEVAASDEAQTRGLMFRTEMGADEGMIFPKEPAQQRSFWMRNTVIPLDMIFVGVDHRIVNVIANAEPYTLEPRPSAGPVIAVLELNGGRAAALGIGPGAQVSW